MKLCTSEIKNILTFYRLTHDSVLFMDDSNTTLDNPNFEPACLDNFLTKNKTCFMNTLIFETGVSDHHKLIGTMQRSTFAKGKPKKKIYCYKSFDNEKFEEKLKNIFTARF